MKITTVCSMNQNRSMALHNVLAQNGFSVTSFGTSNRIKLPGETPDSFNEYSYGTTYAEIQEDLIRKNSPFYSKRGIIDMLKRNMAIKKAPEYFFSRFKANEMLINENIKKIKPRNIKEDTGTCPIGLHEEPSVENTLKHIQTIEADYNNKQETTNTVKTNTKPFEDEEALNNKVDLVISCDKVCFDKIFKEMSDKDAQGVDTLMLGFEIKDSIRDADAAASAILQFVLFLNEKYKKNCNLLKASEEAMKNYLKNFGQTITVTIIKL